MPLYERLAANRRTRWLAIAIEAATPVLLCLTIAYVVIVQINNNIRFNQAAHNDRVAACMAVQSSNAATVAFLHTRIATVSTSPAQAAAGQAFVEGLSDAYKAVYTTCLNGK